MAPSPVFICGVARSGTTLLLRLLDSHPALACLPEETYFYHELFLKRRAGRWLCALAEFLDAPYLLRAAAMERLERLFFCDRDALQKRLRQWQQAVAPGREPAVLDDLLPDTVSQRRYWKTFLDAYERLFPGRLEASRYWVEKTPSNERFTALSERAFAAQCRYLHIIRDPRDVAASLLTRRGDAGRARDRTLVRSSYLWSLSVRQRDRGARLYGSRYHSLRYEDLVRDPRETLKAVCRFLDIEMIPAMLSATRLGAPVEINSSYGAMPLGSAVVSSQVGRFQDVLTGREIGFIEDLLHEQMRACGYVPTQSSASESRPPRPALPDGARRSLKSRAHAAAAWSAQRKRADGAGGAGSGKPAIVMLVPGFPATENETTWVPPLQALVKAVARRNPEIPIHVVSFQYPYRRGSYPWHGVTVHALAGRNRRLPVRCVTWARAFLLVRRLRRSRAVVLHSHWLAECAYVGAWLSRAYGTTHIATIHGKDACSDNPYLRHLPLDRMTITCLSQNAAKAFFEATGRVVNRVVPIGLEPELAVKSDHPQQRDIDVLGVGSLTPVKDFMSFLEIVAELRGRRPSLRSVIVGEGPQQDALQRYVTGHGLTDVVQFTGRLSRDRVLATMRNAKVLLHTAPYEGQGYVFLEALASGMRIVCHDVGYTGPGAGVNLCASKREMIDAITRLLAAPFVSPDVEVMSSDCTAEAFEALYGVTRR